jgi:putative endonuclease
MLEWSVYMLRCGDGSFYTGIATNVSRRIGEHEQGKRGAKYLRGRGPFELVYERAVGDRSVATRIEYRIKQLPKEEKADQRQLSSRIDELLKELLEPIS